MVDIVNRRCSCGKCIPSFGMPGGSATHCKECKEQGMVDVKSRKKCSCGKCIPCFGMPGGRAPCTLCNGWLCHLAYRRRVYTFRMSIYDA